MKSVVDAILEKFPGEIGKANVAAASDAFERLARAEAD